MPILKLTETETAMKLACLHHLETKQEPFYLFDWQPWMTKEEYQANLIEEERSFFRRDHSWEAYRSAKDAFHDNWKYEVAERFDQSYSPEDFRATPPELML